MPFLYCVVILQRWHVRIPDPVRVSGVSSARGAPHCQQRSVTSQFRHTPSALSMANTCAAVIWTPSRNRGGRDRPCCEEWAAWPIALPGGGVSERGEDAGGPMLQDRKAVQQLRFQCRSRVENQAQRIGE